MSKQGIYQLLPQSLSNKSLPTVRKHSTGQQRPSRRVIGSIVEQQSQPLEPLPAARTPVLILPGFLSSNTVAKGSQYQEMAVNLLELGHPAADILPASRWDWVPTLSGGSFKWYLQRMTVAVQQLADRYGSQVCLVGVSAGGWLARLALSNLPYDGQVFGLCPAVHTLLTCGTPHQSLESYPFGRAEESWILGLTGVPDHITTSLQYANHFLPDADSLKPTQVVCVAGEAVAGAQGSLRELASRVWSRQLKLSEANTWAFIQSSYVANCGVSEVKGDGVCPVETAMLPGAKTLILPDVWHNAAPGVQWYGSKDIVKIWDKYLP